MVGYWAKHLTVYRSKMNIQHQVKVRKTDLAQIYELCNNILDSLIRVAEHNSPDDNLPPDVTFRLYENAKLYMIELKPIYRQLVLQKLGNMTDIPEDSEIYQEIKTLIPRIMDRRINLLNVRKIMKLLANRPSNPDAADDANNDCDSVTAMGIPSDFRDVQVHIDYCRPIIERINALDISETTLLGKQLKELKIRLLLGTKFTAEYIEQLLHICEQRYL